MKKNLSQTILLFICTGFLFLFILPSTPLLGQDFITFYRSDEVGRRVFEMDEETYLNILSFEQPLETIQPWLSAPSGIRSALGSLTPKELWFDQEIKLGVQATDMVMVRAIMRQAVDHDGSYYSFQPNLELKLNDNFELMAPAVLDGDKGNMDGGAGIRYRNPEAGIEYMQIAYTRSDLFFNAHSREYDRSDTIRHPQTVDFQAQGDILNIGLTSITATYLFHSKYEYGERSRYEDYEGFRAWLLHKYDINDRNRLFFKFTHRNTEEEITPFVTGGDPDDTFSGNRAEHTGRLEYQRDLDDEGIRRIRTGVQYVYFMEDEILPGDLEHDHTIFRRETHLYAGYRIPIGLEDKLTLETAVYCGILNNRNRYRYAPNLDGTDPSFQGKVNFYFQWAVKDKVELVLCPSFEIDRPGWGGGSLQLRWFF